MPPSLSFSETGSGPPLVILHGLFGSGINWRRIATTLADEWRVLTPDLVNHGDSPWSDDMSYPAQAEALKQFLNEHQLERPALVGHSMGGKVAMTLALQNPRPLSGLVIVDIAPVSYPHSHLSLVEALENVPIEALSSRKEAESYLAHSINDGALRQFLLQNLRIENGTLRWRINLPVIKKQMALLTAFDPPPSVYDERSLFLYGGESDYVTKEYTPLIKAHFPQAALVEIQDAGHWLHAQKPDEVASAIRSFLKA